MGLAAFYFAAKLYLYFRGFIPFHALPNALLLGYLAAPYWARDSLPSRVRRLHAAAGLACAALLLWYDSYFPPLGWTIDFLARESTRPSASYMAAFVMDYWSPREALALAAILAACVLAGRRRLRVAPAILAVMLVPALRGLYSAPAAAAGVEDRFFAEQAGRKVRFDAPAAGAPPFDVILLHVCSLSWDDLAQVGLEKHPFLSGFDVLFTRFNTVTAYSNPAAIRLLRSPCGQQRHSDLYNDAPADCYLQDVLRGLGFKTFTVFNHDGKYSDMAESARTLGHADAMTALPGLPVQAVDFDGSKIMSDYAALDGWRKLRERGGARRASLYYNTVSLHDGAHALRDQDWWKRARPDKYREFVSALFDDLSRFMGALETSGRDVLVVFVPEHGSALAGTRIQAKGLRDIPLPPITTVPVGVRFISKGRPAPARVVVEKRTSYEGLAFLVAESLRRRSAPGAEPLPAAALDAIPETAFYAENQHARVSEKDGAYYYQGKDRVWTKLSQDLLSRPPAAAAKGAL